MNPGRFDFNPHWFVKGTLQIYITAAGLQLGSILNLVSLSTSESFYQQYPQEVAKLYLVGRYLVVLMSVGNVVLTFLLGRKLYGDQVGKLAAALVAVIPVSVMIGKLMRPDEPLMFWVLVCMLLCAQISLFPRMRWYILAGLAGGFAIATKYPGAFVALVILVAHLYGVRASSGARASHHRLILAYAAMGLGFLMGEPYALLSFDEFLRDVTGTVAWYDAHVSARFVHLGPGWLSYSTYVMPYALGIPMTLVSAWGIVWAIWRRQRSDWLVLAWLVPYSLSLARISWPLMRYLIPLVPFFAILSARALVEVVHGLQRWTTPGLSRIIAVTIGAVVLLHLSVNSLVYNELMSGQDPRIAAVEWINATIPKGAVIGMLEYSWLTPPLSKSGGERFNNENRVGPPDSDYLLVRVRSTEDLAAQPVDYFLISDQQYSGFLVNADRYPKEAAFFTQILEGPDFRLIQSFHRVPTLLGLPYPWMRYPQRELDLQHIVIPPEDLSYLAPNILIFKYEPGATAKNGQQP